MKKTKSSTALSRICSIPEGRETGGPRGEKIHKTDGEWRVVLDPQQFEVCRCGGTEAAFSGEYWNCKDSGIYLCTCCGTRLFSSDTKFDSGSGWPSFWEPISVNGIKEVEDRSLGTLRVEIRCGCCDAHLGHVFPDGPPPTGLRYCINSASLQLRKKARDAGESQ